MVIAETQTNKKFTDEQSDAGLTNGAPFIKSHRKARSARLGMTAAQRLLRGAEKIGTKDKQFRTYIKTGNYDTALADFNSVEPVLETVNPKRIYYGRRKSNQNVTGGHGWKYATDLEKDWGQIQRGVACTGNKAFLRSSVYQNRV